MSRRLQQQPEPDRQDLPWDEVLNVLERQKQLMRSLVPCAPDRQSREKVRDRVYASAVRLFRAYILSSSRAKLIDEAVTETEAKIMDGRTSDKSVVKLVEEMQELALAAEAKFLASLTDEVVQSNELFINYQTEMDELYSELDKLPYPGSSNSNNKKKDETGSTQSTSEGFVPTIDPVTKVPLVDPVKNIQCGHVYGNASIRAIMKQNARAKCPYGGCANTQYLRANHLISDPELAKKIQEKIGREKEGRKSVRLAD